MSQDHTLFPDSHPAGPGSTIAIPHYLAAFMISFAILFFQVATTRLLSLITWYHFSVLPITCAMLALGAAGVFTHLFRGQLAGRTAIFICAAAAMIFGLSIPASMIVLFSSSMDLLDVSPSLALGRMLVILGALLIPLFFGGLVLTIVFHLHPQKFARLYGVDFLGAAAGCAAVFLLLDRLSTPTAMLVVASAVILTPLAYCIRFRLRLLGMLTTVALAAMILLSVRNERFRDIYPHFTKASLFDRSSWQRWSSLAEVTGIIGVGGGNEHGLDPAFPRKHRESLSVVIDGSAGTTTHRFADEADFQEFARQFSHDMFYAAHQLLGQKHSVAIIGAGAGMDVLAARHFGFETIDAVDINPLVSTAVRELAPWTYTRSYEQPGVTLHIEEGRDFIHRARQKYDLVQLVMVDTFAASASGSLALSENHLYTVEAFAEFLSALNDDGMLSVVRWSLETPRLVNLGVEALAAVGIDQPREHLALLHNRRADLESVNLILSRKEFTPEQKVALAQMGDAFNLLLGPTQVNTSQPAVANIDSPLHWPPNLRVVSGGGPAARGEFIVGKAAKHLKNRGYTLATLNSSGQAIENTESFDVCEKPAASAALANAIEAIPDGRVVMLASVDDASGNLSEAAVNALGKLGMTVDLRGRFRLAHAAIGLKGAPPGHAIECGPASKEAVIAVDAGGKPQTGKLLSSKLVDLNALVDPARRAQFVHDYPTDLSAPRDDHPFFFLDTRSVSLASPWTGEDGMGRLVALNAGALLTWLNVIVLVAVVLIVLVPLMAESPQPGLEPRPLHLGLGVLYFICIGLGFMWFEVLLLQKFILFLGHPVYSMTTILFALLLGSGCGSLLVGRFGSRICTPLIVLPLVAAYGLAVTLWLTPRMYDWMSLGTNLNVLISIALIAPGGLLLGMPLPLGRQIFERGLYQQFCWYWGANGAASVLGAASALLIAAQFGYKAVGYAAVASYALAFAAILVSMLRHTDDVQLSVAPVSTLGFPRTGLKAPPTTVVS